MVAQHLSQKYQDAVYRSVEEIQAEMISFLQDLVRIPTINPPGENYKAGAEFIGKTLHEFGYETHYIAANGLAENTPQHPRINVLGRLEGAKPRPCLHFNGHFDVVPAGDGWTMDPFAAHIRDGKLYGRGVSDQKAGIAASIFAVEAIRRAGIKLHGTVEQSGSVDEESGGFAGVAYLAKQGWIGQDKTDYVIITEPTNVDRVCLGHRGVYWFKITTHGRIAHGSMPHFGVSAIDHMADFLHDVTHGLKPVLATRKTAVPVEPAGSRFASININSVFGGQPEEGTQTPCVADRSGAIFDRRFLSEESFEEVRGEIYAMLESLQAKNPDFQYKVEDLMVVHPVHTDENCQLVTTISKNVEELFGKKPKLTASPGTYDQKHVVRIGSVAQCIAYGPGILNQAHLPDEYCLVEDVVSAAKIMALTAIDLLGADPA
ncbi:acetylornithine deacetylase/succinyl-diaminopimelate desuccinylase family protein [Granulicella arctica]|uniref:Succinyl-diaminopimelate desuccinylase n=1 Tax=Granulicella arctica TaxID=940613 RepID=A0A7Y9TLK9_9BACT|nr:acetylornithine deacetylase/succinyl-diaminopimelate desuccinylase family protein [Granulicella arctica]NYF80232.1 succinyl-diaminopimelate desuccinylase [Granulicella arctica]